MNFKMILVSDTHTMHNKLIIPECDVMIYSGDYTNNGKLSEVTSFLDWLVSLKHCRNIIFIEGNHELHNDPMFRTSYEIAKFHRMLEERDINTRNCRIHHLLDEGVTIDGVKFYGSPWTPAFCGWAFNSTRQELQEIWSKVPLDTDVLISHGPPYGYGDQLEGSFERVGDKELLARIYEVNPKLVICGHIHCGAGCYSLSDKTTVLNVALVDEQYYLVRDPVMINYEDFI